MPTTSQRKVLRVLMQGRGDIRTSGGGDAVQLRSTMKYLARLGVEVDLNPSPSADCSGYDIVHLFNITRPYLTLRQIRNARAQRKPVCVSTIYWNIGVLHEKAPRQSHTDRFLGGATRWSGRCKGLCGGMRAEARAEMALFLDPEALKSAQSEILHTADLLLPNGQTELDLLCAEFPFVRRKPAAIIPNCVDLESLPASPGLHVGSPPQRVLCAAQIHPRKNQLRLVRAMAGTGIPVMLAGGSCDRIYALRLRSRMKSTDTMVGKLPHCDLMPLYTNAAVHALPSLYETPGLASLEAGASGCNLVMSGVGCQREYFGDAVEYCDPYSERSIRDAIFRAIDRPWPNLALASFIRTHYPWQEAARRTLAAYRQLLGTSEKRNPITTPCLVF